MFTFVDHAYNASRSVFVYPCRREERERGESVIGFPWCVPLCVTRDDRSTIVCFGAVPRRSAWFCGVLRFDRGLSTVSTA